MKARISLAVVVVALLTLSLVIPYTAAQETAVDPVTAELQAAEAAGHNPLLAAAGTGPASRQAGIPDAILYSWDFEGSNGGFVGTLDWVWGTYNWNGVGCYGTTHTPAAAHSGTDMWGTSLNTCYQNLGNNSGYNTCVNGNPADDSILSFGFDLTGVADPVEMSWWEWNDLFMDWDWGEVYVNGQVVFQHCGGGYVAPTAWVQQVVDLTPYIGGPVNVEIHMMASTVVNYAGWFIDDVMVYTTEPDPDIVVTAPPLEAELCPDTTTVLTFTICNAGGGTLDWALSEALPVKLSGPAARPAAAGARPVELKLEAVSGPGVAANPPVIDAPVSLALDDGGAENYIGLNDSTYGFQFLWLNRFTPAAGDFPFNLTQISVIMGSTGVAVGDPIDLVVYQDTDGDADPTNAAWLATYPVTVQHNDGATWNDYLLAVPLALAGPGDVLIGVINRYQASGVDPSDFPAALDQTATQGRSWVAAWSADPPTPPVLPPDGMWGTIDSFGFPGNWTVRGYGESAAADIPWLSEAPITGTLTAGQCVTVEVTFDSQSMAAGDYYGSLLISSNDPDEPLVTLPVTMTVLDCTGWLEGAITDVETGGADPTCTPATVHVEPGGLDIPADADGWYETALAAGTYTVSASAPGYSVETAVVSVVAGMTTTQDLALRRAVVHVHPAGFDVDLTAGEAVTLPLTVANVGHLPLHWVIVELPPPALMADLPWVSVEPMSGTVPPEHSIDIDVTFTCTQTGEYSGVLQLRHSDPCPPNINIPLMLHCAEPVYRVYLPIVLRNH